MKSERKVIMALALVMSWAVITLLLLPFVLAVRFGSGWLALNYATVPAYLALLWWGEEKKRRAKKASEERRKERA